MLFQSEKEAKWVMEKRSQRLKAFLLELAKTRIFPTSRYKGTREDFDFLRFTFYNTKTREGQYRLGVRTSKKKLKAKKRVAKAWLKAQRNKPVSETMKTLAWMVRGHGNDYGVSGNFLCIQKDWKYLK